MNKIPGLQEYTKELSRKEEEALAICLFGNSKQARVNLYSLILRAVRDGKEVELEKKLAVFPPFVQFLSKLNSGDITVKVCKSRKRPSESASTSNHLGNLRHFRSRDSMPQRKKKLLASQMESTASGPTKKEKITHKTLEHEQSSAKIMTKATEDNEDREWTLLLSQFENALSKSQKEKTILNRKTTKETSLTKNIRKLINDFRPHEPENRATFKLHSEYLGLLSMREVESEDDIFFKWHLISIIDPLLTGSSIPLERYQIELISTLSYPEELDVLFPLHTINNQCARLEKFFKYRNERRKQRMYSLCIKISESGITISPVQVNYTNRASRKFSSSSFLTATIDDIHSNIKPPMKIDLSHPYDLGIWKFLFCKLERKKFFYVRTDKLHSGCELTPQSVRNWFVPLKYNLGQSLSKYNARMSLAFSSTVVVQNSLQPEEYSIVPDINHSKLKTSDSDMTDGCGMISASLMDEVAREFNLPRSPSAIQGRFGSCKGVWVVAPNEQMNGRRLICRESQKKFSFSSDTPSEEHRKLEIVGYAKSQHGTLYKDALLYLTALGLPLSSIRELCQEAIQEKQSKLSSIEELKTETQGSTNRIEKQVNAMLKAGFSLSNPFLHQQIILLHDNYIKNTTKTEAKIPIKKSAFLLMIPDTTGTLCPGEIFVQLSNPSAFECRIVLGKVVLFRSPLQLLSDIQYMQAVDCPAISYIKDCIVFSTQGEIPPASLLAGGDYDGDKAWVIWDERFMTINTVSPIDPPNLSKWVKPHELGIQKLCVIPSSQIQQRLMKYCVSQNAYVHLGYYSNKLSAEIKTRYLGLFHDNHSPDYIAKKLSQNLQIQQLGYLCAAAVDAPKAGNKILRKPLRNHSLSDNIQMPWFDHVPDTFNVDLPPVSCVQDEDLILKTISMENYSHAIRILLHALSILPQQVNSQKLQQLKEKLRPVFATAEEKLCFASQCYLMNRQQVSPCILLWYLFCEELCRLKADSVSLRESGAICMSIIHEHFASF